MASPDRPDPAWVGLADRETARYNQILDEVVELARRSLPTRGPELATVIMMMAVRTKYDRLALAALLAAAVVRLAGEPQ